MVESLLKQLCEIPAPSGYETKITSYLADFMSNAGFKIQFDVVGNLICQKKGSGNFKVMLIAHCDEVGFVVKYIADNGYIYFSSLGKTDISLLYGRHVQITHLGSSVSGVIGSSSTHLGGNDINNKDISNLWIDIGACSKNEVEKKVSVGDSIIIQPVISELGNHMISCKALDNKSSIAALLDACLKIKDMEFPFDLYVVFSVQEEIGLVGSAPASFVVAPDVCIALDVTHATDVPNIDNRKYGLIEINKGPVIPIGSNLSPIIQEKIKEFAAEEGIHFQREALPGFSGTDIAQTQITGSSCYTGLISIPCRYMHSPVEIVSTDDMRCISKLIELLLRKFDDSCVNDLQKKRARNRVLF